MLKSVTVGREEFVNAMMGNPEAIACFPNEAVRRDAAGKVWGGFANAGEEGWPRMYRCSFIEPGVVFYQDLGEDGETILVKKPALDRMLDSFVGRPVINMVHRDVKPSTVADGDADGIVTRVWYDDKDGWYWAEYIVWDELTKQNCESGAYSVSCAYEPTEVGPGGTYHNMEYQEEVLDGEYTHLAVVANPRYEGARILVNSKGGEQMKWRFWPKAERKNAADLDPLKHMVDVDGEKVPLQHLYDAMKDEEAHKAEGPALNDDSVMEVEGKEHKLGDMKNAYRNAKKRKNDSAEEAAKKSEAVMKEKQALELQQKRENDAAEEQRKKDAAAHDAEERKNAAEKEEAEKKKRENDAAEEQRKKDAAAHEAEERKNAEDKAKEEEERKKRENSGKKSFEELRHAAGTRGGEAVAVKIVTPEDRLALGASRYGSAGTKA